MYSNDPELLLFLTEVLFFRTTLKFFHLFSLPIFVHHFCAYFLPKTESTMVNAWQELDVIYWIGTSILQLEVYPMIDNWWHKVVCLSTMTTHINVIKVVFEDTSTVVAKLVKNINSIFSNSSHSMIALPTHYISLAFILIMIIQAEIFFEILTSIRTDNQHIGTCLHFFFECWYAKDEKFMILPRISIPNYCVASEKSWISHLWYYNTGKPFIYP